MDKRTVVIGGGTFNHIRNHMSLAAPAFGNTATLINTKLIENSVPNVSLVLTKMADKRSSIVTNVHLSEYIDLLIADETIGTIIMNAAVCDFEGELEGCVLENGAHSTRLKTADGDQFMKLVPSEKLISKIRMARPDVYLVGFKTTTGATEEEQFSIALKMMKSTKCNLVLANDVVTRRNMIITPEESRYCVTTDREEVLNELVKMTTARHRLTYHRTNLNVDHPSFPLSVTPNSFQRVLQYLLDNGGYIENNGNGFTPGHFCWLDRREGRMYSSQRKVNHNDVYHKGLTGINFNGVDTSDCVVEALGKRKPSVGATSQMLLLSEYPEFDSIIHTHNPLKESSNIPIREQYRYQCGSLECGLNTLSGIEIFEEGDVRIGAVYLDKHGANIMFNSDEDCSIIIINFIEKHLQLGTKVS